MGILCTRDIDHLLPVATARSSLTTLAIIAYRALSCARREIEFRILTINVVVMTLAIPRPCGTISSHRCHCEVLSFQVATIEVATMVIAHDTSVSVYSFPVLRITLPAQGQQMRHERTQAAHD